MGYPFNGVSTEYGETALLNHLAEIKKEIETYYNKLNLVALSPPGAHNETIPEKPAILEYVELIESSGHLLMPGGLMQQPHIFMREYSMALAMKSIFDSIMVNKPK